MHGAQTDHHKTKCQLAMNAEDNAGIQDTTEFNATDSESVILNHAILWNEMESHFILFSTQMGRCGHIFYACVRAYSCLLIRCWFSHRFVLALTRRSSQKMRKLNSTHVWIGMMRMQCLNFSCIQVNYWFGSTTTLLSLILIVNVSKIWFAKHIFQWFINSHILVSYFQCKFFSLLCN